jgi:hypothetical protein
MSDPNLFRPHSTPSRSQSDPYPVESLFKPWLLLTRPNSCPDCVKMPSKSNLNQILSLIWPGPDLPRLCLGEASNKISSKSCSHPSWSKPCPNLPRVYPPLFRMGPYLEHVLMQSLIPSRSRFYIEPDPVSSWTRPCLKQSLTCLDWDPILMRILSRIDPKTKFRQRTCTELDLVPSNPALFQSRHWTKFSYLPPSKPKGSPYFTLANETLPPFSLPIRKMGKCLPFHFRFPSARYWSFPKATNVSIISIQP